MPMLDGFMPCPFCGGRDTMALAQMPIRKGWLTVQCARCEASGPWRTEELAAVAAWNSRPADGVPGTFNDQGEKRG